VKISIQRAHALSQKVDVLVVALPELPEPTGNRKSARRPAELDELDEATDGALWKAAKAEQFRFAADSSLAFDTHGTIGARRVVLLGLGKAEDLEVDSFRAVGGRAWRACRTYDEKVAVLLPPVDIVSASNAAEAAVEGMLLASYRFDRYLSDEPPSEGVTWIRVVHPDVPKRTEHLVARAEAVAEGVALARDLVNEPPRTLSPEAFAAHARRVGKETGLTVNVLDEKDLKKERMELMLAVSAAASPYRPARMVRMAYRPKGKKARKHVVLVGKGLVFDSGGLDIKPAAGMLEMKIDMGGAAAVIGTMLTIGRLAPDIAVTGYLGCVENGIGGNAYHPSDIIKSRKGLTVEVNNTDAEGRLVLADCIDYAIEKDSPDVLIDLATLTGACMIALGPSTAGLFSDDDDLAEDVKSSGERAGESFWRLPLNRALGYQLKSPIADTKNTGDRFGGAITAALFLDKFVDGRARWAHLDIAGPCTQDRDHPYTPRGGAGFGVRTLVGLLAPYS
jgi:leucyl aminopeptidase